MLVADRVLGNVDEDPDLARRYDGRPEGEIEEVVLDERERRKSRFRTTTTAGTDLGVVVEGTDGLAPGDVLVDDDERMVVVAFADREALVVELERVESGAETLATLARVGYEVGNRHWDLATRDGEVLVGLGTDGDRIAETVASELPPGATTRRESVDPTLFDESVDHGHGDEGHDHGEHSHSHGHGTQTHSHGEAHPVVKPGIDSASERPDDDPSAEGGDRR